jgi:hypothetical protein
VGSEEEEWGVGSEEEARVDWSLSSPGPNVTLKATNPTESKSKFLQRPSIGRQLRPNIVPQTHHSARPSLRSVWWDDTQEDSHNFNATPWDPSWVRRGATVVFVHYG